MSKPVKILLVVGCVIAAIAGGGLMALGTLSPETYIYTESEVPKRFRKKVERLGLAEPGDRIHYFYSDALLDICDGMYFVTDRDLVLYSDAWDEPAHTIELQSITGLIPVYNKSFFEDSMISVTSDDGGEYYFPLSSERGRDRKFVEFIRARATLDD